MSVGVVRQHILSGAYYPRNINLHRIPAEDAARQLIKRRLSGQEDVIPIGISYHVDLATGSVDFFCLANLTDAYILEFDEKSNSPRQVFTALLCAAGEEIDVRSISPSHKPCLVGFGLARTAIQVSRTTKSRVRGVDLSTLSLTNVREAKSPSAFIVERIDPSVDKFAIIRLWMNYEESTERDIALQAWLAACAGIQAKQELRGALKVDTDRINLAEKTCLSQLVGQCDMLDSKKPKEVPNEFDEVTTDRNRGLVHILNARYKTRIRKGDQTEVRIADADGTVFRTRAIRVQGRTTTLACSSRNGKLPSTNPQHLKVFGRPESTNHEKAREEFIFLVLTGGLTDLRQSPFVRMLWFPQWRHLKSKRSDINSQHAERVIKSMKLNRSQGAAVRAMIGNSAVEIVHGPPGTGKTTTIAAACQVWDQLRLPVWVVAHSNVAVKNIAETLCKKRVNFKLIVSKEFYEEWHEHIYKNLARGLLIRSDRLPPNQEGMRRVLSDTSIILCTLNLLSNPVLTGNGTFEVVPPRRLVVDEASQINVFDFMHLFVKFQGTLEKVCFFGDPMQLPPFGQEDVPSIQTIFDLKHLMKADNECFLQMQYRMPSPIATFISRFVYGNKLLSSRSDVSPDCLAFIHAPGAEERHGFSRKNTSEIETIVNLVKHYYRYRKFCVITPYDAQRAAIQSRLKRESLPWNAVYNVDSFQGHEEDYVIVSVVRTSVPGFLHSQNRMNVLLTRCRKGLVIVSNKGFLVTGNGQDTLLGKLSGYWHDTYPNRTWINSNLVANASVDLPGVGAPQPAFVPPPLSHTSSTHTPPSDHTPHAPQQMSHIQSFLAASAIQLSSLGASLLHPIYYPPSFLRYVTPWPTGATPLPVAAPQMNPFKAPQSTVSSNRRRRFP